MLMMADEHQAALNAKHYITLSKGTMGIRVMGSHGLVLDSYCKGTLSAEVMSTQGNMYQVKVSFVKPLKMCVLVTPVPDDDPSPTIAARSSPRYI